jgi:hypothetical protein
VFPATPFTPFEGFPSPIAALRHRSRCLLVVAARPSRGGRGLTAPPPAGAHEPKRVASWDPESGEPARSATTGDSRGNPPAEARDSGTEAPTSRREQRVPTRGSTRRRFPFLPTRPASRACGGFLASLRRVVRGHRIRARCRSGRALATRPAEAGVAGVEGLSSGEGGGHATPRGGVVTPLRTTGREARSRHQGAARGRTTRAARRTAQAPAVTRGTRAAEAVGPGSDFEGADLDPVDDALLRKRSSTSSPRRTRASGSRRQLPGPPGSARLVDQRER